MEGYKDLHEAIARGDKELVRGLVQDHPAEEYFSYNGSSALHTAFRNMKYDIASYLIHIGAKINDSEVQNLCKLDIDLTKVNYLLLEYNKKLEKSCIFKLISLSQSPQGLDGKQLDAVRSMYEDMYKSETLKLLMKVIESTSLDIVYDFGSGTVNRMYRYHIIDQEIYGLTSSREIFVGAKALLSGDPQKRAKVYGVVAEELCHFALTLLFENHAKPYREEDRLSKEAFRKIVLNVKSLVERSCHVESVILDVFRNYPPRHWESELISRVPHVIGIYGEEEGKMEFMEQPELQEILHFYEGSVVPKIIDHCDPSVNTKAHKMMEELRKKDEQLSYEEKNIKPFIEGFNSFREYSVDVDGISVITVNCTKLCVLHVYHELKEEYNKLEQKDRFSKECLFFRRETFDRERSKILETLKVLDCKYFTLVLDERKLDLYKLKGEYLCHLKELKSEGMNVIVISRLQSFGDEFKRKTLNYEWNDLSGEYQEFRTRPLRYIFKGAMKVTSIKTEDVPNVFQNESEIVQLMRGEPFIVEDGADEDSRGFVAETYLNRGFKVMAVKKEIFKNLPSETNIFIYGLCLWELKELSIDERLVQWLKQSDDDIRSDRKIFIIEDTKAIPFSEWKRKTPNKSICLHFLKKEFFLSNADPLDTNLNVYIEGKTINEEEILDVLKRNNILMISDDAGFGKSTVISSLVRQVKEKILDSWVIRIDLWKFKLQRDYDLEGSDEEEDLFDEAFEMVGLENGFYRWHFKKSLNQSDYFLFFDGYDEISSKYKSKALEMISFLRKRTNANIVITTRKHDQQKLEETLNTYSHQLVPFNDEEQVNCLGKLLKWKMKYPFGEGDKYSVKNRKAIVRKIKNIIKNLEEKEENYLEQEQLIIATKNIGLGDSLESVRLEIDKLNLTKLAVNILRNTQLEETMIEFMSIPLHLFMVGSILYFDNLNVKIGADLYTLYSKFIDHKILIYVEDKEGYSKEGNEKERMINRVREDIFRIHTELANQLFDEGKEVEIKKEDAELCAALGIVSIHGGKALFLHQTFAEFFKAESIRRNVEKKVLIEIISEDKYKVVKRFLFSALEKKGFENISDELSKDLDFLFDVLKRICNLRRLFGPLGIDSGDICSINIVKQLLKPFKLSDNSEFTKKFIGELNEFIENLDKSVHNKMDDAIRIGCCLNVEIVKYLINRNFKYEKQLICGFVRFAENVEEVIGVLNEVIFKECESGGNEEKRILNGILELLRTEITYENGLIFNAIWNERTEIFPPLLEYFKNGLGEEQFIELFESRVYKEQILLSGMNIRTNRICKLIKEINLKLGNETNILFDFDFQFEVILKAIFDDNWDESSDSFENVINIFNECFGIINLKEFLINGDSDGRYLVHELMRRIKNTNLIKYLDPIKNVLGEEIKDFLKIKNKYFNNNILHFAVQNRNEINFDFLNSYLSEEEIKELLLGRNEFGQTFLHSASYWNPSEIPFWINNAFEILKSDQSDFEKILLMKDEFGYTFLHLIGHSSFASIEDVKQILNNLTSKLSDEMFNKLLRIRNENGETFLQIDREYKKEVIEYCKGMLETELLEELLRTEFEERSE